MKEVINMNESENDSNDNKQEVDITRFHKYGRWWYTTKKRLKMQEDITNGCILIVG